MLVFPFFLLEVIVNWNIVKNVIIGSYKTDVVRCQGVLGQTAEYQDWSPQESPFLAVVSLSQ